MNRCINLVGQYIRKNCCSYYFLVSVVIYSGLLFASTFKEIQWHVANNADAGLYYYLRFAYQNGSTSYILPIVCAISSCMTFCREWRSGAFLYYYSRAGRFSYACASCISSAVTAFITAFAGGLLYVIATSGVTSFAGDQEGVMLEQITAVYANGQLIADGQYVLYYFLALATQGAFMAFMAALTMLISTFLLDPYLTMVSPMVLYILLTNIISMLGLPMLMNPYHVFSSLNIVNKIMYADMLKSTENAYNFSIWSCLYPFAYTIAGIIIFSVLTHLSLRNKLERRRL